MRRREEEAKRQAENPPLSDIQETEFEDDD